MRRTMLVQLSPAVPVLLAPLADAGATGSASEIAAPSPVLPATIPLPKDGEQSAVSGRGATTRGQYRICPRLVRGLAAQWQPARGIRPRADL